MSCNKEIHVEIICHDRSTLTYDQLRQDVANLYKPNSEIVNLQEFTKIANKLLLDNVKDIYVADEIINRQDKSEIVFHPFHLSEEDYIDEFLDNTTKNNEELCQASREIPLPNVQFHGLWNHLVYNKNIKEDLLSYIKTISLLSEKNVDSNIIVCNRIILLHGPPGTGKTSLCKALVQKYSIRQRTRYDEFLFVEINVHSLFSKWFSESGKIVMNVFHSIRELLDSKSTFVFLLLDEIESLAISRSWVLSGGEPSDSLRAVNAVLTQLDRLKSVPNIFIFATSNLREAIDSALLDRIDIHQFIDLPCAKSRYHILSECVYELERCGILKGSIKREPYEEIVSANANDYEGFIWKEILGATKGTSGRSLRKVHVHILALYNHDQISSLEFLRYMAEYLTQNDKNSNADE